MRKPRTGIADKEAAYYTKYLDKPLDAPRLKIEELQVKLITERVKNRRWGNLCRSLLDGTMDAQTAKAEYYNLKGNTK